MSKICLISPLAAKKRYTTKPPNRPTVSSLLPFSFFEEREIPGPGSPRIASQAPRVCGMRRRRALCWIVLMTFSIAWWVVDVQCEPKGRFPCHAMRVRGKPH